MDYEYNPYNARWKSLECATDMPRFARKIISIDYDEFAKDVMSGNKEFVEKITSSLYEGDIYLLKNAFSNSFLDDLLEKVYKIWHSEPSSFHKC